MTELKTLKDLSVDLREKDMEIEFEKASGYRFIPEEKARQEAIKWVKKYQDEIFNLEERASKGLDIEKMKIWENIGKSNVLMDFFNITEEELK